MMDKKVSVSVIIPIYNVEEYLEECLESVVNQSMRKNAFGSIEIIMVDDGSTDTSGEIAQKYAQKYEDFYYIRKENGGLGQARNYGINYAHGEYIAFLDSDDIVPEYAYEKMYHMAEKTGNDLIVGDVLRFKTNRYYNSNLHRKAFKNPSENTHILERPELVYDTTSWNKLYKFDWWKQNGFCFPEHILYEDIPVTIPAHFMANRVSILEDVVYYWRVRDGVNKSITQNRTDYSNFSDRLKIMKMVDGFYHNYVRDETALYMKNYKWLQVDLMLYIDQLSKADDEYIEKVLNEIREYIKNIPNDVFESLRTIDRMKYFLIQQGDIDNLLNLLRYSKRGYKALKIKYKNGKYIGKYPLSYIPKELCDMTFELNEYPVTQKVKNVFWDNNTLTIRGYIYQKGLNVAYKNSQEISAKLVCDENISFKLPVVQVKESNLKWIFKINKETKTFTRYNYEWAGYEIKINLDEISLSDYVDKKFKIEITYKRDAIEKHFYLGHPQKGKNSRANSQLINNLNVYPGYTLGYDFMISLNKPQGIVEKIEPMEERYIVTAIIPSNEELVLLGDDESLFPTLLKEETVETKEKKKVTVEILQPNKNGTEYKLALNNQKNSQVVFASQCEKSHVLITKQGTFSMFRKIEGSIIFKKRENSAVVRNIELLNNKVFIEAALYNDFLDKVDPNHFQLHLEGKENGRNYSLTATQIEYRNQEIGLLFEIDLEDNEVLGRLTQDKWISNLIFKDGIKEQSYLLLGDFDANSQKITKNMHNYKIHIDAQQNLCLWVGLVWKKYENTKQKRRIIVKYLYPLLRLLPIKKNRIIFEGWWGQKYHCNPRYLYEYINERYPEYECIWSMNDENYLINGKGKTVRRNSLKYHFYMATAKYFVNNVNFMDSYEKRKGQIEIQTMHGTPLKTLGLDVPGEINSEAQREKFLRRCNRWDYLIVQSKEAERITSSCFAYKKQFLRTGYPRNDILFTLNTQEGISAIKQELNIPVDKKVILYAPTWRKRNKFDMMLDINDMKEKLGDAYVLLLRIHPYALAGFDNDILDEFVYNVSSYPSIEKLYVISDLLITDYSSAMFDYAILNRPILFFTYDLESYRDNLRGFNIDLETEAPGPLYACSEDVVNAIANIASTSEKYNNALQTFRKKYCEYETGHACEKIMKEVFGK